MGIVGNRSIWTPESFGHELVEITIGDLLDQQAERFGDKEALVYHYPEIGLERRLSYRTWPSLKTGTIPIDGQCAAEWCCLPPRRA